MLEEFATVTLPGDPESFECYIYNISVGGVMLYSNHEFKINDKFSLSLTIKDKTFKKECIVKGSKNFTHNQRYVLQIGKSLNVSYRVNVMFIEPLTVSEIEYIRLNHL